MGSVYEARHEMLGSTVALKFLHPELSRRAGLVQRFLQEARVSAAIQSPHVVRVSDVDQTSSGLAYIVMECIEGRTLQTLYEDLYRARQRLSYNDALNYAMQILEGVEAAHRAGVVHRDLKPDNVMITKGLKGEPLIKLLDFGIAKLKLPGEKEKGLTRPGVMMGTPEYMAPEQVFSADAVDARADIFSLGVIFFEMFAGRRPVGGDDPQQIASAYLTGQIAQLTELAPNVPANLARAIHKAMAASPADRFATVADLRAELEPFLPGSLGTTPAPEAATALQRPAHEPPAEHRPVPKTLPPADDPEPNAPAIRESAPDPFAPRGPAGTPLGGFALATPAAAPAVTPEGFGPTARPVDLGPRTESPSSNLPFGGGGTDIPARPFEAPVPTAGYPLNHVPGTAMDSATASAEPNGRLRGRGGLGLLGILLAAGAAAGAVVGGIYVINLATTTAPPADPEPLTSSTPATTTTAETASTSEAAIPPSPTSAPPLFQPPVAHPPPPVTWKPPTPTPSTTTTTTPPGRPAIPYPTGIPWPPLLPGFPTTPPQPTTPPTQPTTPPTQPTTPAPTTTSAPPATTGRRPIIIRMPK
jgi:serine/threonine-protein kinase